MLQFSDFLIGLLGLIALLVSAYLLGGLMQFIVLKSQAKKLGTNPNDIGLFWKLCSGTFLLISLFAISTTQGKTMLLLSPLLIYVLQFQLLKSAITYTSSAQKFLKKFGLAALVLNILFYAWALFDFQNNLSTFVSGDFNIYYRIALNIAHTSIENPALDPIHPAAYAAPYHFGDIWLYALVTKVFGANPSIMYLIAFSFLSVVFSLGIGHFVVAKFQHKLEGRWYYIYFLLLTGLFTGFKAFFPSFVLPGVEAYTLSVMNWSKVLIPSILFVSLIHLLHYNNWFILCIWVMLGGLSFINALPALYMTCFFLLLYATIKKEITIKQFLSWNVVYVLATLVFLVMLYKLLPHFLGLEAKEATGIVMEKHLDIAGYLMRVIKIFIGGWFQLFVMLPYLLLLALMLILHRKQSAWKGYFSGIQKELFFFLFLLSSGLICWALLHPFNPDAVQFFTNSLSPVYAIFIALLYALFVVCWLKYVLAFALVAFWSFIQHLHAVFFVQQRDTQEWHQLNQFISKNGDHAQFVNFRAMGHFNSYFDKNTIYFLPISNLVYRWNDYQNYCLNTPFIKANQESPYAQEEKLELALAPYSLYYTAQKQANPLHSNDSIMYEFIKTHKIAYICVSADTVVPAVLRAYLKDSILLKNENTKLYRIQP